MSEDKIAEASKRVSEYKVDMSKYPMLARSDVAIRQEQERAETLDRAIEVTTKLVDSIRFVGVNVWNVGTISEAMQLITELKKLRGEV